MVVAKSLREEQYQDRLARLFGQTGSLEGINDSFVKTITFQVTDDCCLACTYCYQQNKGHHTMTFDTAKKLIDAILADDPKTSGYLTSHKALGVIIEFIGGEPFLAIDLIDEITDYFIGEMIRLGHPWATRYMISICSNGVHYFDPKVQAYIHKNLSHLSFSISVDGDKRLHDACRVFPDGTGSYDTAMAGVQHFMNVLGGDMGSKMTIAPENVRYVREAVKSLIANGYKHINLNCVYEDVWSPTDAAKLYWQLKGLADYLVENDLPDSVYISIFSGTDSHRRTDDTNWCGGDGHMLAVDWKGDLYPCLRYMESSIGSAQAPYIIGNVYTGIGSCDEEQCRLNCLERLTVSSQSEQKCIDCPISAGCGWCSAYNYQTFGTVNRRATFICQMHQARVLATAHYINSWNRKIGRPERYEVLIPAEWAKAIIPRAEFDWLRREAER